MIIIDPTLRVVMKMYQGSEKFLTMVLQHLWCTQVHHKIQLERALKI